MSDQKRNPSVNAIVTEWLKANGYTGLFNEDMACGCPIDELSICGECPGECKAGHKVECEPEDCDDCSIREEIDCEGWHEGMWFIRGRRGEK